MAVLSGLTCPIVDPTVWEMRRALLVGDMLLGKDEFCMNYISTSGKKLGKGEEVERISTEKERKGAGLDILKEAVISGKRKDALALTQKVLDEGLDPQDIIDDHLIPALNIVGEKFEKKKIFVPEMMMAAKSLSRACRVRAMASFRLPEMTASFKAPSSVSSCSSSLVVGLISPPLWDLFPEVAI